MRGGYYTPLSAASMIVRWAVTHDNARVLEPSAGDGVFVKAVSEQLGVGGRILAVELDPNEAAKIQEQQATDCSDCEVIVDDFFAWFERNRPINQFDVVIGNPPFLRYKDVPSSQMLKAFELMKSEGLNPNKMTNAWVPFVVASVRSLRIGGRLGMVLPFEVLQAQYASELREYLIKNFSSLTIVSFRKPLFPMIQQEAIVLLGIKSVPSPQLSLSVVELDEPSHVAQSRSGIHHSLALSMQQGRGKWTQYYLSPSDLEFMGSCFDSSTSARLGDLTEIDIGVVTGNNRFFVLTSEQVSELQAHPFCLPLVGRASHIQGLRFQSMDYEKLVGEGAKCYLLSLDIANKNAMPDRIRSYIENGEESGVNEGRKCRDRGSAWWRLRSVWSPDAFMTRQVHEGPRIVSNEFEGTTCTDTILRVKVNESFDKDWLAAASMNSLTFATAELKGRSYGGGVLELLPSEAEEMLLPRNCGKLDLGELDHFARSADIEEVVSQIDLKVLSPLGMSPNDIAKLNSIWKKMRDRRFSHRHKKVNRNSNSG